MYVKKSHSDRHSITTWFIETLDENTDKYVRSQISGANLQYLLCGDGQYRHLWVCNQIFVKEMWKFKEAFKLKFHVFHRSGAKGEIKEVA